MTIHNASPKIASMFDRMIHFDGKETCRMIERKGPATVPAFITESTQDKNMHITYRGIVLSIYRATLIACLGKKCSENNVLKNFIQQTSCCTPVVLPRKKVNSRFRLNILSNEGVSSGAIYLADLYIGMGDIGK
eukprot:scaffold3835_cov295-Chaetoceros_neogracile.AAC.5